MNAIDRLQEVSGAINDAMLPTAKEAADYAARYHALKNAKYITADGDVLTKFDYEKECEYLNARLKQYIERNGSLYVEGIGEHVIQQRSGPWVWDVKALREADPQTFDRAVELGALTFSTSVADALEKAGQLTMFRQFGYKSAGAEALVVKKDAR